MPTNPQTRAEKPLADIFPEDETHHAPTCEGALIERLPFALTYAASLEPQDHAVLFYDNLVVAAEYFCAFIEEGIRQGQVTCFTGLEPTRYRRLFEQVGIRTAELENCGYLRNLSTETFYNEAEQLNRGKTDINSDDPLRTGLDYNPTGIRFLHIQESPCQQTNSLQELLENERKAHRLYSIPTTSICCYDAKFVLEDAPSEFFKELLKTHDHCLFQGIAMPTSRLLGLQRNTVYPRLRTA